MKKPVPTQNATEHNAQGKTAMWIIPIVQYIQKVEHSYAQRYKRHRVKRAWRRTGAVVGEHGRTTAGAQNKKNIGICTAGRSPP